MKTNFFGTQDVCTELLPLMKPRGESVAAFQAAPLSLALASLKLGQSLCSLGLNSLWSLILSLQPLILSLHVRLHCNHPLCVQGLLFHMLTL